MAERCYICGLTSGGAYAQWAWETRRADMGLYPEIADDGAYDFSLVQAYDDQLPPTELPRAVVSILDPDGAIHAEVAYDKDTNPLGYDWLEVFDDGKVVVHAP